MNIDLSPSARAALDAQYEILRELGRGGTAVVYLARDRATGTDVAIKLVRSKYLDDEEALARFAREARLVEQLRHPNIVPVRAVLDFGGSGIGIVMEHLAGRTLREVLSSDGFLTPPRAERVIRDIGHALEAAHAAGIIHRDVKPENIFLEDDGRAVLADFGLARSMADTELTMHGVALGTPAYMSPEQIDSAILDGRADIYSLGLVGWEMLAGRRPWGGESLYGILYRQKYEMLADLRDLREGVPDTLAEVIARSIEKDRDARWPDVRALLEALDSTPTDRPLPVVPLRAAETMRFVRTPESAVPMLSMKELAALIPELEERPRRRWAPIIASVVSVVVVVGALAAFLLRPRSTSDSFQVVPAGDVRRPVELQATGEASPLVHPDSTALVAAAVGSSAPAPPARSAPASSASARPALPASNDSAKPTTPTPPDTRTPLDVKRPELDRIVTAVRSPTITVPPEAQAIAPSPTIIAAGGMHSCFINPGGRALCWGGNEQHQLGGRAGESSGPIAVATSERFATIAAGLSHSCAITREGSAWCWGSNDHGQLGDGSRNPRLAPDRVADAHVFRAIAAGVAHTCGLDAYGLAWCWGSNARGQLGDSTTRDSAVPVNVRGGRFVAVVAGWNFACGLTGSGSVSCWGDNGAGQLGDGSTSDRRVPVALASPVPFTSIAAGSSHACGVTAAGEAYCWGQNRNGQLGDGTNVDRATPVLVHSTAHFVSITTGGVHTCALADDGAAFCWGRNTYGQLGTGRTTDESVPTRVVDGHSFASVRAFGSHTCGVTVTGEPFCWGYNLQYQLGDGTRTHRMRPVRVEISGG
jgi:serine/threonine protein kinase/alpha-tubulin suppressor-like RCC1 family protein